MSERISFRRARLLIGCTGAWLTSQIDKGLVDYTLEFNPRNGTSYRLLKSDVLKLEPPAPEVVETVLPEPTGPRVYSRLAMREMAGEARTLGMSLSTYLDEIAT